MKKPLQPLKAYVESLGEREWSATSYITLYRHPHDRFVIQVESCPEPFTRLDRYDILADQGIDVSDDDSKEFAEEFVKTFCEHVSLHDMEHLRDALDVSIKEWYAQRDALNDKK